MSFNSKLKPIRCEDVKVPTYRLFKYAPYYGNKQHTFILLTYREIPAESNAEALVIFSTDEEKHPVGYKSMWSLFKTLSVIPYIGEITLIQDAN